MRYEEEAPSEGGYGIIKDDKEINKGSDVEPDVKADEVVSDEVISNWREDYADGDDKKLTYAKRYTDQKSMLNAGYQAQQKIRSGELTELFPDKGSDEEKATWRKEAGLPESSADYKVNTKEGVVIGEPEQARIDDFLKVAHENNYTQAQVDQAIKWHEGHDLAVAEEARNSQLQSIQDTEDELRTEWGVDYRGNLTAINNDLNSRLGEDQADLKESILNSVKENAGFARLMAQMSIDINPAARLVPSGTTDMSGSIDAQINDLKALMGNKNSEYYKGPKAADNQAKYLKLISAKSREL